MAREQGLRLLLGRRIFVMPFAFAGMVGVWIVHAGLPLIAFRSQVLNWGGNDRAYHYLPGRLPKEFTTKAANPCSKVP